MSAMRNAWRWVGCVLLLGAVACDGGTPSESDGGVDGGTDGGAGPVCGDGVVQAPEQCDDGNEVAFDGCESDCRFTCNDASECSDGNPCNGDEDCPADQRLCVVGTPPAEGASCTTDTVESGVCSAARECVPVGCGNGVVDPPEECDDGNTVSGDGCESDCTFTCTEDADCDDLLACNGEETCDLATNTCAAGTAPTCTASDACHEASCSDADGGCIETLIDADMDGEAATSLGACGTDCDDDDPERNAGNVEICGNGIDDDCDGATPDTAMTLYYADCDNDGYAAMGATGLAACMPPATCGGGSCACVTRAPTSSSNTDCRDNSSSVRPNQGTFFTSPIPGVPSAVDYDYNCDRVETRQVTCVAKSTTASCPLRSLRYGCDGPPVLCAMPPCCTTGGGTGGWTGTTVPSCGASAQYTYCRDTGISCVRTTITRTQACR